MTSTSRLLSAVTPQLLSPDSPQLKESQHYSFGMRAIIDKPYNWTHRFGNDYWIDNYKVFSQMWTIYGWTDLKPSMIHRIAEFMPRLSHFTILCQINKQCHRLFSTQFYFSSSEELNLKLFSRDVRYFQQCIKFQYFGINDKRMVTVFDDVFKFLNHSETLSMLKYYLIFYERFLILQQRWNRCLYRRSFHSQSFPPLNVFSTAVSTLTVASKAIQSNEIKWISQVIEFSSGQTRFVFWDLSNSGLTDTHIDIIAKSMRNRVFMHPMRLLNLSHNLELTNGNQLFPALVERCPKLADLNLEGTGVSDNQTKDFRAKWVKLNAK